MKLKEMVYKRINDNTEIKVYEENPAYTNKKLVAKGRWFHDCVLSHLNRRVVDWEWEDGSNTICVTLT